MRKRGLAYKNLVLGVEFDKYLLEHPEIVDRIPNRSTVVLLPEYDQELYEANLKLAEKRIAKGEKIVFVRIQKLAPLKSRIIRPRIELAESA
ncbi:MAG: hypothetical protein HYT78_06600 [Deltaproteobacteria bacterium]|nr:hypothetical protein [Deltaproteobacteria bacterium]